MMIKKTLIFILFCSLAYGQVKPLPNNAYELKLSDDCIATLGDEKSASFKSQVDFRFWDEDNITFEEENVSGLQTYSDGVIELVQPKRTLRYKLDGSSIKWIEILKEKPSSNKWSLKLGGNWKDFSFKYQTKFADILPLYTDGSIEYFERDGEDWIRLNYDKSRSPLGSSERPLSIEGSIAVYHNTKVNHCRGGVDYGTGKVLHIPRPKATDATGKWVFCEIQVVAGVYTRTTPPTFLENSTYPVTINDVLGEEGVGGTDFGVDSELCSFRLAGTMPFAGTLDEIHIYDSDTSAVNNCYMGLYSNTGGGGDPDVRVYKSSELDWGSGAAWHEHVCESNPALGNGLEMYVAVATQNNTDWKMKYDEDSAFFAHHAGYDIPSPAPDPFDGNEWPDRIGSGHIVYTKTAAGFNMWLIRNNKTGGKLSKR